LAQSQSGFRDRRKNVSKRGSLIPKKLKSDAILEALFEARFSTLTQPEFLIVRLAEFAPWRAYSQARLPAYGIPENIRQIDPNLRYQPTYELLEPSKQRSVRIGPNVISYHLRQPYVGWPEFSQELRALVAKLFDSAESLVFNRLGLRYVNAFSPKLHGIQGIQDLDLSVTVAGTPVKANVNVNFSSLAFEQTNAAVRIASPEFFALQPGIEASALADIDVFTREGFETTTKNSIFDWLELARNSKNEEFFCLLTPETISKLKED
jgi:uncharacterized protein (TIGR04255 family)